MNAQVPSLRNPIALPVRRMATIAFVLLYCPLLVLVITTLSFSEVDNAHSFVAQIASQPPAPLPTLPKVHVVRWPEISMQRDPMQPLVASTKPESAQSLDTPGNTDSPNAIRFIASVRDADQRYVLGRSAAGKLSRFRVGNKVDAGVITRIDPSRVILTEGGQQRSVDLLSPEQAANANNSD